jgi:hypothetical protein
MDSLSIFGVVTVVALVASIHISGVLRRIWGQYERRIIDRKWQQRERLLDSPRPVGPLPGIREWRSRPASVRDVSRAEPGRLLYIVARDQPELFAFVRRGFAAEVAEAEIEILMNRRQRVQPRETDGRDPRRNWDGSAGFRQIGFSLVRQQTGLPVYREPPIKHHGVARTTRWSE